MEIQPPPPEAEPKDALDRAFDDYVQEIGTDAFAAQFEVPIESIHLRKVNGPIVRFLFSRQEDLHQAKIQQLAVKRPTIALKQPQVRNAPETNIYADSGQPESWLDPLPRRRDSGPAPNAPVM